MGVSLAAVVVRWCQDVGWGGGEGCGAHVKRAQPSPIPRKRRSTSGSSSCMIASPHGPWLALFTA
eukprot:COSAG04_NODE_2925_length_3378_cov_3.018298_2_plen_65_part_00